MRYGIRAPRGLLLHGPPGCGKTALAIAAAGAAGATLFVLNGSDLVSEFAGDSEAGLRGACNYMARRVQSLRVPIQLLMWVHLHACTALNRGLSGLVPHTVAHEAIQAMLTTSAHAWRQGVCCGAGGGAGGDAVTPTRKQSTFGITLFLCLHCWQNRQLSAHPWLQASLPRRVPRRRR